MVKEDEYMKAEIKSFLSKGLQKRTNENIIDLCNPRMELIYYNKGGICVHCKTLFKIMLSLTEHLKRGCGKQIKKRKIDKKRLENTRQRLSDK